jgi:hypothetical protein
MPLTSKGEKIMRSMKAELGSKEGERRFYASKNAGTISGVDQGRANPSGHYTRVGGLNPSDRIKGRTLLGITENGFVPGGKRR